MGSEPIPDLELTRPRDHGFGGGVASVVASLVESGVERRIAPVRPWFRYLALLCSWVVLAALPSSILQADYPSKTILGLRATCMKTCTEKEDAHAGTLDTPLKKDRVRRRCQRGECGT